MKLLRYYFCELLDRSLGHNVFPEITWLCALKQIHQFYIRSRQTPCNKEAQLVNFPTAPQRLLPVSPSIVLFLCGFCTLSCGSQDILCLGNRVSLLNFSFNYILWDNPSMNPNKSTSNCSYNQQQLSICIHMSSRHLIVNIYMKYLKDIKIALFVNIFIYYRWRASIYHLNPCLSSPNWKVVPGEEASSRNERNY